MSNDATILDARLASVPIVARPAEEALQLTWSPPPGMVALSFKNFAYRIATFGIYNFWGKTEVRKRIWSAIRINGEPLQYTGTGKEMLLGFLFVLAVLTVPTLIVTIAAIAVLGPRGAEAMQLVFSVLFFFLVGVGTHRAIRYRMSRTLWRGIRGGLAGSSWAYGWTYFWTGLLLVVTLGWASPWRATKLQGLVVNDLRFGNRPFAFNATPGPLYGPFAGLWICAVAIMLVVGYGLFAAFYGMQDMRRLMPGQQPNLSVMVQIIAIIYGGLLVGFLLFAVVSAWYRARMMNHFAAHTSFEAVRFSGTATGRSLIWLSITNMLMVVLTLGLLSPVAQTRSARYFVERLRMTGGASLDQILQGAHHEGRGEGLAQAFDIDAF